MRPVNLIPPEERRGDRAPTRTGLTAYAIVALLAVALVGVTATVLVANKVSDRKSEVAELEQQKQQVEAKAQRLEGYSQFASMRAARVATVKSLADSRFDWERVMRELSLILPSDVWLINLTGTASPDVEIEDGAEVQTRDSVTGPAMEIIGCGASQESVARFVAALRDIDGVTRVGVASSKLPDLAAGTGTATTTEENADDCRTRDFIARFEIVIAFDQAPVPQIAGATSPTTPAPATTTPPQPASTGSTEGSETAEVRQQEAASKDSIGAQSAKAHKAVGWLPGN